MHQSKAGAPFVTNSLFFLCGSLGGGLMGLALLIAIKVLVSLATPSSTPVADVADGTPLPNTSSIIPVAETETEEWPVMSERTVALSADKLRRIGVAFHEFHSAYDMFCFAPENERSLRQSKGLTTGLSWRVHLLPFLELKPLYDKFHLDEPWNSPHNLTLLDQMPEVYRVEESEKNTTRFRVLTGENMLFRDNKPANMRDISDGQRHTILALLTGEEKAVAWTKPDDMRLDPEDPFGSLGRLPNGYVYCVMVDTQLLAVSEELDPQTLLALATPSGSEIVDADTLRREFGDSILSGVKRTRTRRGKVRVDAPTTRPTGPSPQSLQAQRYEKLGHLYSAFVLYHGSYDHFPVAPHRDHFDADGRPYLSWRVHLLPFLERMPLYEKFKLNEPWDSPHNSALISEMPDFYLHPTDPVGTTTTRFVTLVGEQTPYQAQRGPKLADFKDGTQSTILLVEVAADRSVPWTKPEDAPFNPNDPVACLGTIADQDFPCVFANGAIFRLRKSIPPPLFKTLVTPEGGEQLNENDAQHMIPR